MCAGGGVLPTNFYGKTFYSGISLARVRDLFISRPTSIPSLSIIHKFVQKFEKCANISVESEARN
jgi:hypothetical protein